jgi:hypothetical protein
MTAADIYFDTSLSVKDQLPLLKALFEKWGIPNYTEYYYPHINYFSYRPADKFLLAIGYNNHLGETDEPCDRFRYKLTYIDTGQQFTTDENIQRLTEILQLLWSHQLPTCTPGYEDELPMAGGAEGPVKWPE